MLCRSICNLLGASMIMLAAPSVVIAGNTVGQSQARCVMPGALAEQRIDRRVSIFEGPAGNPGVFACLDTVNRIIELRPLGNILDLPHIVLAGDTLAYVARPDDFNSRFFIRSVNLRTGEYRHSADYNPKGSGGITDLVANPGGSFAWAGDDGDHPDTLRIFDQRGRRVPRYGHNMQPGTLRLRGSRLCWRQHRIRRCTKFK